MATLNASFTSKFALETNDNGLHTQNTHMILSDDSLVMALFLQIHWIHRGLISKFTDLHWDNTYIDMDVLSLCEITLNMDMMTSQHKILNSFIKKWYLRIISCQNKMGKKMF